MKHFPNVALVAALSLLALAPAHAADNLIGKMNDTGATPFSSRAYDIGADSAGRRIYVPAHALLDPTGAPFLTSGNPGFFTLSGVVPLPTGASTAAAQATGNASLGSLVTNTTGLATAAGQATAAASLASIDGKTPTAGQKNMAGSSPVVLASDQTVAVAGNVTVTGGSTAANQTTANTSLASIDGKTPALTSAALAQTCTALPAGTSTTFVAANANRRSLRWQNVGTGAMTVAPGTAAVVVGAGLNYDPADAVGKQGGGTSFDGAATPAGAFSAISTAGTTVCAWEGN